MDGSRWAWILLRTGEVIGNGGCWGAGIKDASACWCNGWEVFWDRQECHILPVRLSLFCSFCLFFFFFFF